MSLKLVAVGCMHGKLHKNVMDLIKSEKPDAVILSGDFSGGDFADKLREYEKSLIEKFGVISEFWPLKVQIDSEKKFRKWARESASNTEKIFRQLKKTGIPTFYIHGNWDSVSSDRDKRYFEGSGDFMINDEEGGNMKFIHRKVAHLKGYSIAGFGGYRGTSVKEYLYRDLPQPWPDPNYISDIKNDIGTEMEKLFSKVKDKKKMIFVTHDPPYRTFDYLESAKKFYGEKISRDVIEKHKPLLCICSHFHEHRGTKKIGKTVVAATGFGREGQAAVIEIDKKVSVRLVG